MLSYTSIHITSIGLIWVVLSACSKPEVTIEKMSTREINERLAVYNRDGLGELTPSERGETPLVSSAEADRMDDELQKRAAHSIKPFVEIWKTERRGWVRAYSLMYLWSPPESERPIVKELIREVLRDNIPRISAMGAHNACVLMKNGYFTYDDSELNRWIIDAIESENNKSARHLYFMAIDSALRTDQSLSIPQVRSSAIAKFVQEGVKKGTWKNELSQKHAVKLDEMYRKLRVENTGSGLSPEPKVR